MTHPCHMSLYPTMDSMVDVMQYIESQLPITNPNELFPLLMAYHNTLLKELESVPDDGSCPLFESILQRNLDLDGYELFKPYKAMLLKDLDDQFTAGTYVNAVRTKGEMCLTRFNQPQVIAVGVTEGIDYKLVR